jgi:catabolite regulation protein CreA
LTERLSKDFFSDPSDASVTCVKTGTIQIADNIATGKNGEVRAFVYSYGEFLKCGVIVMLNAERMLLYKW